MQDPQYLSPGQQDGVEVGMQHTLDGADILVERSDTGIRMAQLLSSEPLEAVRQGNTICWAGYGWTAPAGG